MKIINLASGSKGNLTYLESDGAKILIDDGLSCAETVKRLEKINVAPNELSAILITHEHSDHIKGVDVLSSKFNIPVYAHKSVWLGLDDKLKKVSSLNRKEYEESFNLLDLQIDPIELPHDVKCFGYSVSEGQRKISVLTDLGHINDRILASARGSAIVYLEANYDRKMLMSGTKYPLSLKMRIDGPNGHLCNSVTSKAVEYLSATGTRQFVLSHLSEENNSPSLAYNSVCEDIKKEGIIEGEDIKIDVATPNIGAMFKLK